MCHCLIYTGDEFTRTPLREMMALVQAPTLLGWEGSHISGTSWLAVALFVTGTAFVILLLFYLLKDERFRRPPRPEKGVEFVAARRATETQISALAPKVMLLAEKEKSVTGYLDKGTLREETRRGIERMIRDAVPGEFWERIVETTAMGDFDPVQAHEELRRLSTITEMALEKLRRAEEIAYRGEDAGCE